MRKKKKAPLQTPPMFQAPQQNFKNYQFRRIFVRTDSYLSDFEFLIVEHLASFLIIERSRLTKSCASYLSWSLSVRYVLFSLIMFSFSLSWSRSAVVRLFSWLSSFHIDFFPFKRPCHFCNYTRNPFYRTRVHLFFMAEPCMIERLSQMLQYMA